jgi:hypothetical protein
MQVSLEKLEECKRFIAAINAVPLSEIEWTRCGKVEPVTLEQIDEFKFVGLSNATFPEFMGMIEPYT